MAISGGNLGNVTVSPASRVADILVKGAAATGTPITGSDDPGGFINGAGGDTPTGGAGGNSGGAGGPSSGSAGTDSGGGAVVGGDGPTGAGATAGEGVSGGLAVAGGPVASAGASGSTPGSPGAAPTSSGCACTVTASERSGSWSLATLFLLGAGAYCRRKRASGQAGKRASGPRSNLHAGCTVAAGSALDFGVYGTSFV